MAPVFIPGVCVISVMRGRLGEGGGQGCLEVLPALSLPCIPTCGTHPPKHTRTPGHWRPLITHSLNHSFIHSLFHSFSQSLWSTSSVPSTVLVPGETGMNQMGNSALTGFTVSWGKTDDKHRTEYTIGVIRQCMC